MKICISAGGTGGHISPGVALYKSFKSKNFDVLFITNPHALEFPIIKEEVNSKDIAQIPISRGFSKNIIKNLKTLIEFIKSVFASVKILKNFNPDKIVLTGGYASAPVGIAGFLLGKDVILLEQNAVMGTTNKILSSISKAVILSFPLGKENKKFILIGNPIRYSLEDKMIKDSARNILGLEPSERKVIGIVLGSQGAKKVNEFLCENIEKILEEFDVIWIPGTNYYETILSKTKNLVASLSEKGFQLKIFPFITKMNIFFSAIDIAITRAGASTLSELSFFGVPAVLIPFPHAAHNHQYHNAKHFEKKGAAVVIEEKNLTTENLLEAVRLINNNLSIFSSNVRNVFPQNVTDVVADKILRL